MNHYSDSIKFKNIYLEDSFVLSIEETKRCLSFVVEVVLNEGHALYTQPRKDENYCYKKAIIVFRELKRVEWLVKQDNVYVDKNDSHDYGNIDNFMLGQNRYYLVGDWGEVMIYSAAPTLDWFS